MEKPSITTEGAGASKPDIEESLQCVCTCLIVGAAPNHAVSALVSLSAANVSQHGSVERARRFTKEDEILVIVWLRLGPGLRLLRRAAGADAAGLARVGQSGLPAGAGQY